MFPWSAVFSVDPKVPGQRSAEELVTDTLMLELGAVVKSMQRVHLEKAALARHRRASNSPDYSWLAEPPRHVPYELAPGDVLDLQDLCAKIPPQQCGPVIVRFRKLVTEFEPEVHEVPQLFRSVLRNCLDEAQGDAELHGRVNRWEKQRSKSLSFVTFRSKFCTLGRSRLSFSSSPRNLQDVWSDEDEPAQHLTTAARPARIRSQSLPEIMPLEQDTQST
ncbi:protein RD3 [Brachyhypopomus gauderio]|uniref:protein RD3 n=1 Tax=Brachyhypopomus gauderio TaxID=698409 RepID=UPI004042CB3F